MIKVQKGTKDILPAEMPLWHFMEAKADEVFSKYGAKEIRTPIFEATELFARGVGDTTDIVNKEMYTFEKSERSLTLRPENTAGVVRSFIENGMHRLSAPVKLWYKGPMFRYERPQAGRQRQFHQVGVEVFGIKQPTADAEVILMEECKEIYAKPEIQAVIQSDFICEECADHFNKLKEYLNALNINYSINKLLVRGLDYYNRTVFEIKSNNLGSQNAVCGGGRYDSLVKNLGGEDTPAIGFAMGMERLASLIREKEDKKLDAFIVCNNPLEAVKFAEELRQQGINCEFDLANKKFVKQLEKASKVARFALILGEDEIASNQVTIKNLETSEQKTVERNNIDLQ